jgi:hypothetical protein
MSRHMAGAYVHCANHDNDRDMDEDVCGVHLTCRCLAAWTFSLDKQDDQRKRLRHAPPSVASSVNAVSQLPQNSAFTAPSTVTVKHDFD